MGFTGHLCRHPDIKQSTDSHLKSVFMNRLCCAWCNLTRCEFLHFRKKKKKKKTRKLDKDKKEWIEEHQVILRDESLHIRTVFYDKDY